MKNSDSEEKQIFFEQVRSLYDHIPFFFVGSTIGALVTVVLFWNNVQASLAITWLLLIISIYSYFLYLHFKFIRVKPENMDLKYWYSIFVSLGWVATTTWGSIGYVFYDSGNVIQQLILMTSLSIGAAAVMATTLICRQVFYTAIMLLVPLIVRLITDNPGSMQLAMAAGIVAYLFLLFYLHKNINKSYIEALRLRFRNKSLADELKKQKHEIEKANIAKSRFLGMASHDLRQPLHVLGLLSENMREKVNSPNECLMLLERMDSSIETMNNFFSGLLDLSKFDTGRVKVKRKTFPIAELISIFKHDYTLRLEKNNLNLRVVQCKSTVYSDPVLLRRIIGNFLENAMHHTEQGRILLGCRRSHNSLRIEVWDTGKGISDEDKERIFLEFEKVTPVSTNTKHNIDGLGLGLAVVKQLSNMLDHKIDLRSVPGKGSVFSILIPLARENLIHFTDESIIDKLDIKDVLKGANILSIDQDIKVLSFIKEFLETLGCNVISALSTNEAIIKLKENTFVPDVIVADYCMHEGDSGLNAVNNIRQAMSINIPAVIVSSEISSDILGHIKSNGINILEKPVVPSNLGTLLRYLLSQNKLSDKIV